MSERDERLRVHDDVRDYEWPGGRRRLRWRVKLSWRIWWLVTAVADRRVQAAGYDNPEYWDTEWEVTVSNESGWFLRFTHVGQFETLPLPHDLVQECLSQLTADLLGFVVYPGEMRSDVLHDRPPVNLEPGTPSPDRTGPPPRPWRFEFENHTGPGDEGYREWYKLRDADGRTVGRVDDQAAAAFVCRVVNQAGFDESREEPSEGPRGRCDTCGAACDATGCTADRDHETAL